MIKNLAVIADVSGSMVSQGKYGILQLALRTVSYFSDSNSCAIKIYALNGDGLNELANFAKLPPTCGKTTIAALNSLIDTFTAGTTILLLSDGYFNNSDESTQFIKMCKDKQLSLLCFAVGADSKKNWFTGKNTPKAEKVSDIASRLQDLIHEV